MTIRTKRLIAAGSIPAATGVVATCPVGYTWLIKQIVLNNQQVVQVTVTLGISNTTTGRIFLEVVPANTIKVFTGLFLVLKENQTLDGVSAGGICRIHAFGAQLLGVSP